MLSREPFRAPDVEHLVARVRSLRCEVDRLDLRIGKIRARRMQLRASLGVGLALPWMMVSVAVWALVIAHVVRH
jgi:hypothetical protein